MYCTTAERVSVTKKNIGTSSTGSDELQLAVAVAEADMLLSYGKKLK